MADELAEAFPGITEEQLLHRPPLSNGRPTPSKKTDSNGEPQYQCTTHKAIDCDVCFDWGKRVVEQVKRVAGTIGKEIPVDLSRDEKLGLMASMGIELPATNRLPDEAIEKKFRSSVDAAQYFGKVVRNGKLDPAGLAVWSTRSGKTLVEAVARGNLGEGMGREGIMRVRGESAFPKYEKAFIELRQGISTIASAMDQGVECAALQDVEHSSAICLRIVELRRIDIEGNESGVPVFSVLYQHHDNTSPAHDGLGWIADNMRSGRGLAEITMSVGAQKLFLVFLRLNAKRLASIYHPPRRPFENLFIPSFIIPVGPITQQDTGSLTKSAGCVVCGNKSSKKCSACLSVEYCGPECQKSHWKEHKPACKSLKGGTWLNVDVVPQHEYLSSFIPGGGSPFSYSFQDPLHGAGNPNTLASSVADSNNIHGTNPFLVKIQKALLGDTGAMLIYDRQRSFQFNLLRAKDGKAHAEALREMNVNSATGLKIYRWAKRTGDRQLSICFDRPPPSDPLW
ncbi:hypothetical protein V5O48_011196 [Marasmius crinis-equi]|uniref:MYND-type domain-containing protein n=1 Tax=Marasmius crinis-equi TaxID=585013 RepID=A0ABR3F690_9AGAR